MRARLRAARVRHERRGRRPSPTRHTQASAALAQERYYSSYGDASDANDSSAALDANQTQIQSARAQERYYSSYGEPEPLVAPQPPAPSDDTPWLPIALAIAARAGHRRRKRDPAAPAPHPPPSRRPSQDVDAPDHRRPPHP